MTSYADATTVDRDTLVRRAVIFEHAAAGQPAGMVFGAGQAAVRVPVDDALPVLMHARGDDEAHPSTAAWSHVAMLALRLVARGRLREPDPTDSAQLRSAAAALAPDERGAEQAVHGFLRALADTMPHSDTPTAVREPPPRPRRSHRPRTESTVRISLRIDFTAPDEPADGDPGDHQAAGSTNDPAAGPTGCSAAPAAAVAVVCVHDTADASRVIDAGDLWADDDHGLAPRARVDVISAVDRAAHVWTALQRLRDNLTEGRVVLDDDELADLRSGVVTGRLLAAGIEVRWPRDLRSLLTRQPVVHRTGAPTTGSRSVLGRDAAFGIDWRLALGDDPLTEDELHTLANAVRGVVHLRGHWFVVDPETVRRASETASTPLEPIDAVRVALTETASVDGARVAVTATGALEELRRELTEPAGPPAAAPPAGLEATLRDYQRRGLAWLVRMSDLGLGGCLADDMGLGKTVMVIALHLHRATEPVRHGPTLVVCPASVLGNWEREIRRFAPGIHLHRFHGLQRDLPDDDAGVVLTTYATMRSDAERLAGRDGGWGLVIADEAQQVKNPNSSTARALRTIHAQARIALTGTPVENNLSELWAILDWTTPGLLGDFDDFRRRWARPIESRGDDATARELSRLIHPFLLRRRKSDPGIAPELPTKTETDRQVHLTREQAGLYEAVVGQALAEVAAAEGMRRRGLILRLLTACKQICNHPAHYLADCSGSLARRSGKLVALDDLVDTVLAEDGSVLIFTQFVAMGRLLERHLRDRGIEPLFLHGATPLRGREAMVEQFQAGQRRVLLLSLQAGGTGLNLTRADHVIHYDRWWNPAVEDQATDRAHRMGQSRPVQVHRLITAGTVEDRVTELLASKRALAESVLNGGEAALTEMADDDLADLVGLRAR